MRSDGHVLLFYSATAGALALLGASLIVYWMGPQARCIDDFWHRIIPFEHSGKAALAFVIAAALWIPLNWFFDDGDESGKVINYRRNPLEILFRTAMDNGQLIALSLKNRKVYVGYIISSSNPAFPLDSVAIIPMMSGYRRSEDHTVEFTTKYIDAYDKMQATITERVRKEASVDSTLSEEAIKEWIQEEADKEINIFRHIIMVREIDTAFVFRLDIYEKYFGPKPAPLRLLEGRS